MPVRVCWYTEQGWAEVKAFAADPERFEASFPEWEAMANDAIAKFRALGMNVGKFLVNPSELRAWCQANGRENEGGARAQFASSSVETEPNG
jgi:hypothetical protein